MLEAILSKLNWQSLFKLAKVDSELNERVRPYRRKYVDCIAEKKRWPNHYDRDYMASLSPRRIKVEVARLKQLEHSWSDTDNIIIPLSPDAAGKLPKRQHNTKIINQMLLLKWLAWLATAIQEPSLS